MDVFVFFAWSGTVLTLDNPEGAGWRGCSLAKVCLLIIPNSGHRVLAYRLQHSDLRTSKLHAMTSVDRQDVLKFNIGAGPDVVNCGLHAT